MKITLKTSVLRAALICAAKKDLRYYLQGVCVSINHPQIAMVYGTDGHILFAGQCPIVVIDAPEAYGFQIIIPSDTIKAIDKKSEFIDMKPLKVVQRIIIFWAMPVFRPSMHVIPTFPVLFPPVMPFQN